MLGTPRAQAAAAKDCAALGESLWAPTPNLNLNGDSFLSYLAYQAGEPRPTPKKGYPPLSGLSHQQLYFVAGHGRKGACQAITTSAQIVSVSCNTVLPALCSQSAPLSGMNYSDTSARFQTQVSSGNAVYTGYRDKLSFRFLGIQYGTYPQRFTYSSAYAASGEVSALDFGAICRQKDAITNVNDGSEDCLHLNIYTPYLPGPEDKNPQLKPVMLWIHGGAFINGYGSDPTFDGGNLASRGDVVLVTINYRFVFHSRPLLQGR